MVLNIEIFVCVTTVDKVLRGLAACICRCAQRARALALVPDCAWSAAEASVRVRGGRCRRLVLVVPHTEVVLGGTWRGAARTYRRAATVARQGLRAQSLFCY